MTASHSPKRRRLDRDSMQTSRNDPAMPGDSATLKDEFQQRSMIEDMNRRLQDCISSCWATDKAKGAAEHGNVCKVKVKSMGRGVSELLTMQLSH